MSLQMNKGKQHLSLSRIPVFLQLFFKVSHVMGPATQQTLRENKDQQRIQRKHNVVNGRKKNLYLLLDFKSSLNSLNLVLRMFSKEKT
jgi:hypothetical protein